MAILPEFLRETPPVTRYLIFGTLLTTLAVNFGYLRELKVFFNWRLFLFKGEYWRAITTFLYIGPLGLEPILYLSFFLRFMSMLEEASPPPRTKNFMKTISIHALYLVLETSIVQSLDFGLFDVKAPYVPWVMILLRWFRSGSFPVLDLLSASIGHIYFFLYDFGTI